jgi:Ca2+-binding EF-hand superfamily protein
LKLAFDVFDKDGGGRITADEMRAVMHQFELTNLELDEMLKEFDGDGSIGFE